MSTCLSWINRKMLQVFLVKTGEKPTNIFFTIKKLNKLKVFKTERSDFNPVRLLWSTTWTLLAFTYQLTDRRNLWMWKHSSPLTHVHGLKTCFIWLKCSSAGFGWASFWEVSELQWHVFVFQHLISIAVIILPTSKYFLFASFFSGQWITCFTFSE